jgi:hypothetical protein
VSGGIVGAVASLLSAGFGAGGAGGGGATTTFPPIAATAAGSGTRSMQPHFVHLHCLPAESGAVFRSWLQRVQRKVIMAGICE